MINQECIDKLKSELDFPVKRFYGHMWIKEEWRIIQSALLKMAMHMLSPIEREIVKLAFFYDLSEEEVSKKLKMGKDEIKSLRKKALRALEKSKFLKLALSPEALREKTACTSTQVVIENN